MNNHMTVQINLDHATIRVWGLFMYKDFQAGEQSISAFWTDYQNNRLKFDDCTGVYRIEIHCTDGRRIYFCDNSGCARYYFHENSETFYTSLMEVLPRAERKPNYQAIAQFLYFGCIYGMETVLEGVVRSDPEKYYIVDQDVLHIKDKELTPLAKLDVPDDVLEEQMRRLADSAAQYGQLACTITGGTDSRAILAHMLYQRMNPVLDITGHDGQADVEIAKEIAEITGLNLLMVSDEPEGDSWIDEAITAADGMNGVCDIYRLYKKAQQLKQNGIKLECGGAAGELYKNSFINQDLPLYLGKPRWKRFVQYKVATYDFPEHLCGEKVKTEIANIPNWVLVHFSQHRGSNKANAYLNAGYELMQARVSCVYSMSTQWYIHYNPLLERHVAAIAFRKNPYALEMQAYQRSQVTKYCPNIKMVNTDRGLTCDRGRMLNEFVKSNLFLVQVALQRIFQRGKTQQRIDPCFEQGLSSQQFQSALKRCKELGIVPDDIQKKQIPYGIADRLFTIGMLF